ncbi:hypothetical protein [Streptacidiphilus sp. PAMC 29251]
MLLPNTAVAAQYAKGQVWSPPQTPLAQAKSVPGSYVSKVRPAAKAPAQSAYSTPAVDLPRAGQSATSLASPGKQAMQALPDGKVVSGAAVRVGTSPLWVAPAATGAAAPSGVQVRFAAPATARKGGITSGVLFGLERADHSTAGAGSPCNWTRAC